MLEECRGCLLWRILRLDDFAVLDVYGAVGDAGEVFVVSHDDKGLSELVAQVEEELVEFSFVF